MKELPVPLSRISLQNRKFSFSRGGDTGILETSIRKQGLLEPLDLMTEGRRHILVRGRRRLTVLRRLGYSTVRARAYAPGEISDFEAWTMNFHDTVSRRKLNPAESCTAVLQLLDLGVDHSAIITHYLPLLGLSPKRKTVTQCLAVSALGDSVLDALAANAITLPTAIFLSSLPVAERRSAFRFLLRRPLTASRQREWCRLAADVAARDGTTLSALLASVGRSASRKAGTPGEAALHVLRERRYPSLSEHRRAFLAFTKKHRLPPWFRVEAHPFFERSGLNVRFSAETVADWTRALEILARLDGNPDLTSFLSCRPKGRNKG